MTGLRAVGPLAAALAIALVAWLVAARDEGRTARSPVREAPPGQDLATGAPPDAPGPEASPEAAAAPPAAAPLDLSFHLETGSGAILVELSIRPADARVHLRAAGESLLGSSGGRGASSECGFSYRGRPFRADLAWDDAMRLKSLRLRGEHEPLPGAEVLLDLFAEDGTTIASERPPGAVDAKDAAYVLERRRQVAGGVAHDLLVTLGPVAE